MNKKSTLNVYQTTIRFSQKRAKKIINDAARLRGMSFNQFVAQTSYDAAGIVLSAAAPTTPGALAAESIIAKDAQPLEN